MSSSTDSSTDYSTQLKSRGRNKFQHRHSLRKTTRARSSSPPGGNFTKCCSFCCPAFSINVERRLWNQFLIQSTQEN